MKKPLSLLISLGGIIFVCMPGVAQNPQDREGVLYSTEYSAKSLEDVVPCDAIAYPVLYYIPVDEMRCEIPGGYGIDFEGTLELQEQQVRDPEQDYLTLFAIE